MTHTECVELRDSLLLYYSDKIIEFIPFILLDIIKYQDEFESIERLIDFFDFSTENRDLKQFIERIVMFARLII